MEISEVLNRAADDIQRHGWWGGGSGSDGRGSSVAITSWAVRPSASFQDQMSAKESASVEVSA